MAAKAKAALAAFEPRTAAQREAAAAKRPLLRGVAARARLFARRRGQQAHHLGEGRRQGGQHNAHAYWGTDEQPAALSDVTILAVDDKWVKYGRGRNDKFRNPRIEGGFVINATELRLVNFSMEPIDPPAYIPRSSGRRAAAVTAPKPKRYRMAKEIDHEIRAACW